MQYVQYSFWVPHPLIIFKTSSPWNNSPYHMQKCRNFVLRRSLNGVVCHKRVWYSFILSFLNFLMTTHYLWSLVWQTLRDYSFGQRIMGTEFKECLLSSIFDRRRSFWHVCMDASGFQQKKIHIFGGTMIVSESIQKHLCLVYLGVTAPWAMR